MAANDADIDEARAKEKRAEAREVAVLFALALDSASGCRRSAFSSVGNDALLVLALA